MTMHFYQFNIGDYKSHTEHLSEMEDLVFRRLLDLYYLHESPLPLDIETIARLIRMRAHCECIADVLREFFERTDDGWLNRRAQSEIEKVGKKSKQAKDAANSRWLKDKEKLNNADAMRTQCGRNATQDTEHKTQNTKQKKKDLDKNFSNPEEVPPIDGLDVDAWNQWVQYRKEIKKPLKPASMRAAMKSLVKHGVMQAAVVERSIANGWQGLFEIKTPPPHQSGIGGRRDGMFQEVV